MSPQKPHKTRYLALKYIGLLLTGIFSVWWFNPHRIAHNFSGDWHVLDFAVFALLTYVVWQQIVGQLLMWSIATRIGEPFKREPEPGLKVAFITTFVPSCEPIQLLHNILPAMKAADYTHDVWLLDEGNDPAAKAICEQYDVFYFSRKDIDKYNTKGGTFAAKTKGGNHNAWYDYFGHAYDIVAQIDTDFIPNRNFLTATLGFFRDPEIGFVGTPQVYGNTKHSLVARGAAQQTYSFYGPMMRGLQGMEMTLMIGANHIVRVAALKEIGLYAGHLTEDMLTGMTLHAKKWKSVYVPETLAVGEGPATWADYFNQQMRWAFGCMDILMRHTPGLMRKLNRRQAWHYLVLQQHYFSGLAMGLGLFLLSLYCFFGITPAAMELSNMLAAYLPLLIWQYVLSRWLQQFFIDPKHESGMHLSGGIISVASWPIYFMALVGVLRGKRLVFKVTPKGNKSVNYTPPHIFTPHIAMGTVAAADIAAAALWHHNSVFMLFWAVTTMISLYGLVFSVLIPQFFRSRKTVPMNTELAG